MIIVKNLNKFYNRNKSNEIHVINNTSLTITSPGLVTFLGPSGAGKSTLLHVIGGLDRAKGEILHDTVNFNRVSSRIADDYRNKHIGYIFQNYNLLPNLTVYENLKIQLDLIHIHDKDTIDKKITECLKIVGMEKYKRRNITALSGGQQQRVAIARALAKGPEVIIADEPTGNLDSKNSMEIMNILKVLSKKFLVVLVTHDLQLARYYSDRIITIRDGTVIDDQINENSNSLLHIDPNALYLNQYQKKILQDENSKISIFQKEPSSVQLNVIVEGDSIYIENTSSLPVKLVGETTDKYTMAEMPEEEKIDESSVLNMDYLISEKQTFRKVMLNFFKGLKESFLGLLGNSKKLKFLYASFIFIGMILCLCLNSLSISTTLTEDAGGESPVGAVRMNIANAYDGSKYGYTLESKEFIEILKNNPQSISGIVDYIKNPFFAFNTMANRSITINLSGNIYITTPKIFNNNDTLLKSNEIIISNKVADIILSYTSSFGVSSYTDLIGKEFAITLPSLFTGDVVIKDIAHTNNKLLLVNEMIYFGGQRTTFASQHIQYSYCSSADDIENIMQNALPVKHDLVRFSSKNAWISKSLYDYFVIYDKMLKCYRCSSTYFDIAGILDTDDFKIVFPYKEYYEGFLALSLTDDKIVLPSETLLDSPIKLARGKLPMNYGEILLPDLLFYRNSYSVGSSFPYKEFKFKVVGFFTPDYPFNVNHIYTTYRTANILKSRYAFDRIINNNRKILDFYVSDQEQAVEYFDSIGYSAVDPRQEALENNLLNKIDASRIAIIISTCIVVVMILFIFFINRSKMIHNIYEIGVMRALGAKKSKLYRKYLLDSLILTTVTVVLGFTIMYLFTLNVNSFIPGIAIGIEYYLLSIISLYVIMLLAAIAPLFFLLRKTPIEIINKYDI